MTPIGVLLGIILGYIIFLFPFVLIIFSKLVSGNRKIKWLAMILVLPIIINIIYSFIARSSWIPHIPGLLPMIAWCIYLLFKIKYESPKKKRTPKIVLLIVFLSIIVSILVSIFTTYSEQESDVILQCGSEKIFIKNFEPNQLYLSLSYISESYSTHIGELDGSNILLSIGGENNRGLKECLSYSDTYKLVYPVGSKYTKDWIWEKETYDINSTMIFSTEESVCSDDEEGNAPYTAWRVKHADLNISTNRTDSFVFEINGTKHIVKAESIEYNPNWSFLPYSTIENKYIFRVSVDNLSKVVIWKFSKDGNFLKEIHVRLPDNIKMELNKSYDFSHLNIDNNKIQFRFYESYRGNKQQNWENICKYSTLEIENIR